MGPVQSGFGARSVAIRAWGLGIRYQEWCGMFIDTGGLAWRDQGMHVKGGSRDCRTNIQSP